MPISDVLSAFIACNNDPAKICDLFEETPLEKRALLNTIVKDSLGLEITTLYNQVTQCAISLYFDFENSIPSRCEALEIENENGQIFDSEMTGYSNVETTTARTPQYETRNESVNATVFMEIEHGINRCQIEKPTKGQMNQRTLLECSHHIIVEEQPQDAELQREPQEFRAQQASQTVMQPMSPETVRRLYGETSSSYMTEESQVVQILPSLTQNSQIVQHTPLDSPRTLGDHDRPQKRVEQNVAPPLIRKIRQSRFCTPRNIECAAGVNVESSETTFTLAALHHKRRKTDDVIIYDVVHNGIRALITINANTALQLVRDNDGAPAFKFGTYNFVCPSVKEQLAHQYASWLFSQIEGGHLNL